MDNQNKELNSFFDELVIEEIEQTKNKAKTEKAQKKLNRNIDIFRQYHGIDSPKGLTLEAIGKEYDLTRECIRQIVNRVESKIGFGKETNKALTKLFKVMKSETPVRSDQLAEKAFEEEVLSSPDVNIVGTLKIASKLLEREIPCDIEKYNDKVFFLKEDSVKPEKIESEVNRVINRYGASTVSSIAERTGLTQSIKTQQYIKTVLNTCFDPVYFDAEEQWFYFEKEKQNRMERRLNQVFSVYEEVSIDKLYQAMTRSLRQAQDNGSSSPESRAFNCEDEDGNFKPEKNRKMAMNKKVFRRYLESKGFLIKGQKVSVDKTTKPEIKPLPLELSTVEVIKESTDSVMKESEIENDERVSRKTQSHYSFVTTMYYSPLVIRPKRGFLETLD